MRNLAFLKLRLKGLSIRKPFQAEYPSIYIIVQDFNLAIVLGILRYETLSKRTIRLSPNTYYHQLEPLLPHRANWH